MKETKKKESGLAKKSVFVTLVGLVAIVVIALTMNLVVQRDTEHEQTQEEWEDLLGQSAMQDDEFYEEEAEAVHATMLPEETEETPKTAEDAAEETAVEPAEAPDTAPKAVLMEKPVPGGITKDYSPEDLVYSDTMEDWRVHEGLDFAAEEKTEVKAVADGTVETVSQDGLFGACLVIRHPDGIQTFYGNLEEGSMPEVGTQVKTGQAIGRVGRTATVEINDKPHLHFEVRKDGKATNPHDFLIDTVTDDE